MPIMLSVSLKPLNCRLILPFWLVAVEWLPAAMPSVPRNFSVAPRASLSMSPVIRKTTISTPLNIAKCSAEGVGAVFGGSVNHGGIVAGFHADLQISRVVEYIAVKVDDVDKLFVFFGAFVVFDLD